MKKGFKAVKSDQLDAFIYDATVLEYLVGQDDECNVLTVGSWYAMTGYGVGFPKNSMWIQKFNEYLMRYRQNGDLERMQHFWFTGACDPREKRRTSSKPLALAQVCDVVQGVSKQTVDLVFYYTPCIGNRKALSNKKGFYNMEYKEVVDIRRR